MILDDSIKLAAERGSNFDEKNGRLYCMCHLLMSASLLGERQET